MTTFENYLQDGANYQAQAVLALMRPRMRSIVDDYHKDCKVDVEVGRFENCREQGYVFTLYANYEQIGHYAVYEHRNSDNLIVLIQKGITLNTPRADFMFGERGKYDYDKGFSCEEVVPCADFIDENMRSLINDYIIVKKHKEDEK